VRRVGRDSTRLMASCYHCAPSRWSGFESHGNLRAQRLSNMTILRMF
jgi:hypothetical protein